ncbi:Uncharacterised protein [Vibrio cholerae]|nr:Uncharacterised protein [Vibrio cholerae]
MLFVECRRRSDFSQLRLIILFWQLQIVKSERLLDRLRKPVRG